MNGLLFENKPLGEVLMSIETIMGDLDDSIDELPSMESHLTTLDDLDHLLDMKDALSEYPNGNAQFSMEMLAISKQYGVSELPDDLDESLEIVISSVSKVLLTSLGILIGLTTVFYKKFRERQTALIKKTNKVRNQLAKLDPSVDKTQDVFTAGLFKKAKWIGSPDQISQRLRTYKDLRKVSSSMIKVGRREFDKVLSSDESKATEFSGKIVQAGARVFSPLSKVSGVEITKKEDRVYFEIGTKINKTAIISYPSTKDAIDPSSEGFIEEVKERLVRVFRKKVPVMDRAQVNEALKEMVELSALPIRDKELKDLFKDMSKTLENRKKTSDTAANNRTLKTMNKSMKEYTGTLHKVLRLTAIGSYGVMQDTLWWSTNSMKTWSNK